MKLSETLLDSLNDIDAVYLEKSEKEYGWLYRYRRQLTAVLSFSLILVFFTVLTPKMQSSDGGSNAAVPVESESMKQEENAYDSAVTAGAGEEIYMIRLQDENGNEPDAAALKEVCDILLEQGYDVWIDDEGSLFIAGQSDELKAYLEQLKYSYELIEQ